MNKKLDLIPVNGNLRKIKELSEKLNESDQIFSLFLTEGSDGYWDWYPQENTEFYSDTFWTSLGYDPKTKTNSSNEWMEHIHPDDLITTLKNYRKCVESKGKHPYSQIVRYKHAAGNWVQVACKGKIIKWSEDGLPLRVVGIHIILPEGECS